MAENFALSLANIQKSKIIHELRACNELTQNFGLQLTEPQIVAIVQKNAEALMNAGRMEFGSSVIKDLVMEFCDSNLVEPKEYETVLAGLLELFYYFKNESLEALTDEELLKALRKRFDEYGGALEYLRSMSLEALLGVPDPMEEDENDEETFE